MIGVMPLRIWKSQLGSLVTDTRRRPISSISAIQRPPIRRHPRRGRIRLANDAPACMSRPLLGTCIHGWRSRRNVPNTAKIAFSGIEPAGDAPNQTVVQWVMAQIRYLAEQWNFCNEQRIFDALTIE